MGLHQRGGWGLQQDLKTGDYRIRLTGLSDFKTALGKKEEKSRKIINASTLLKVASRFTGTCTAGWVG